MKRVLLIFIMFGIISGCSITAGYVSPQSHYVFPNSNVTPLGQVSAEASKRSFLVIPTVDSAMVDEAMNAALARAPGADLLVDVSIDTRISTFLYFYTATVTVQGTAVSMEIGMQDLNH
ncbi:MAG: hypothetical protein ACXIUB_06780 [Wenzhouxiangella sp.]